MSEHKPWRSAPTIANSMITRKRLIPANIVGTVVDLETTGLPHEGAEVITLGTVSGNHLHIIQRTDEKNFAAFARSFLSKMPRPFYAFYKSFEESMLGIKVDGELQFQAYEKKARAISVAELLDPFNGEGYGAVAAWKNYVQTGNADYLTPIMDHNESDLLLETCLLIVRHSREEKIEVGIDV